MAPVLTHPSGVNFLDEQQRPPVNSDAATYYGGEEQFSRSRTYSAVRIDPSSTRCLPGSFPRRSHLLMDTTLNDQRLTMTGFGDKGECLMMRRALAPDGF